MDDLLGFGKLAETVGRGLSRCFRPIFIRREMMALIDATVAADQGLGVLPTKVQYGDLVIDLARIAAQDDLRAHRNLRGILDAATRALPPAVSDDPVDDAWVSRFFSGARDVSGEGLEALWGHLLANEVAVPGSVGLRTLDIVRNLSSAEAAAFTAACQLSIQGGIVYPFSRLPSVEPQLQQLARSKQIDENSFDRFLDAGLIRMQPSDAYYCPLHDDGSRLIQLAGTELWARHEDKSKNLFFPAARLTVAGAEIRRTMKLEADEEVVAVFVEIISGRGFKVGRERQPTTENERLAGGARQATGVATQ